MRGSDPAPAPKLIMALCSRHADGSGDMPSARAQNAMINVR